MLTDEQLTDRIRASLRAEAAGVEPPADLLARIRRDPATRRRRLRVPSLGGSLAALAAGSAVAIAVVAIVLIGHQRSTSTGLSAVPPQARGLASELAILRRPHSAGDSLPAWAIRGETFGNTHERPLPGLTRLAAALPAPPASGATEPRGTVIPPVGRVRVFLTVWPARSSTYGRAAGATLTALVISKWSGTAKSAETGTESVTASQLYAPINVTPCLCGVLASGPGYNVGIVPDGVARVRWVFNGRYTFANAQHRRPFAVYPTIQNNIAVAPIQRNQGTVTSVTWYAADGRVIRQLNHAWSP